MLTARPVPTRRKGCPDACYRHARHSNTPVLSFFRIIQDREQIGAARIGYHVPIYDNLRLRVYLDPQLTIGFPALVSDTSVPYLFLFEISHVNKGHSLHIDTEQKQVSGKSEHLLVNKGENRQTFDNPAVNGSLASFSCPVNDLRKGRLSICMISSSNA